MNDSSASPSREASEVSYGDGSPTNSVVSWQVDLAGTLLQNQENLSEYRSEPSSATFMSEEYEEDSPPWDFPSVSSSRVKEERRVRELEHTKEGLRRDKIVRMMNSRYQRRFDPMKWNYFQQFNRLLKSREHRFRKPLRQVFEKRLLQPKHSQMISIDYLVSCVITHYYPMASISPKRSRGGGSGKAPEIGRAIFETYSLDLDGDEKYRRNMQNAEKLIRRICQCYDYNEDGTCDWREILCALEVLKTPPIEKPELLHIIQFWWEVFDTHNVGFMKWRPDWLAALTTASMSDWDYEFISGLGARVFLHTESSIEDGGWKTLNPSVEDIEKTHEHGLVYYDQMMRVLQNTHMGSKLMGEIRRQLWARNPEDRRLKVIEERCDRQTEVINQLEDRIFKKEIANVWLQVEPPKRFHKWKNALYVIDGRHLADAWFSKKAKMRGLRCWLEYAPAKRKRRRIRDLVKRHAGRKFEKEYICKWKAWKDTQKAIYDASLLRATKMYHERVYRNNFDLWKATATVWREEREEQIRKAIELWNSNSFEFCFHRWKENADHQIAERQAQYRQQHFLMEMSEGDQEAERQRMAYEENLTREFLAAEAAKIEKDNFEAMWAAQRHKTDQTLLAKAQEEKRLAYKEGVIKAKLDHDDDTWEVLAKSAAQKAENEARGFMASKDGKKHLNELVKAFKKQTEEEILASIDDGTANVEGCLWQVFKEVDPRGVLNTKVFWFKESTMERYYDDVLETKIQKDICLEIFVAQKKFETYSKAAKMKQNQQDAYYEEVAAKKIQAAWRNLKTRRLVRRVARQQWEKAVDPESGEIYYRNKKSGESSWTKPHIFGSEDVADPPVWCVRIDPRTKGYYYFNRVNEDLSTKKKPKGYLLCCECQTYFGTRRCMDKSCSGARFCADCCIQYHKVPARAEHRIEDVKVKIALCKVCQNTATILCYGCLGECYCERCSKLVHMAEEMAEHTAYEKIA